MRTELFVLLACLVAGSYAAILNFYDRGDEEECPAGMRCTSVDLCPGATQPNQPFWPGNRGGWGLGPGQGRGLPRRAARCSSGLRGARVCCWTPSGLPPSYHPRFARQASSPSQRACEGYRRSQPRRQPASVVARSIRSVVGGEPANTAEFPYMVAIGYVRGRGNSSTDLHWGCGGSLISDRYVLTAAHCITDAERINMRPVALRTGTNYLSVGPQIPSDYSVESVTRHPRHLPDLKYFDLALLRTDRPVSFSTSAAPVCLATPETLVGANSPLIVAGWGATDPDGFDMSPDLKKAELRFVGLEECKNFIRQRTDLPRGLDDTMICAAEPQRQADTCKGDSGGPMVVRAPQGDMVVGVTSFGGRPCASSTPGVYARVLSELSWIESVVWS